MNNAPLGHASASSSLKILWLLPLTLLIAVSTAGGALVMRWYIGSTTTLTDSDLLDESNGPDAVASEDATADATADATDDIELAEDLWEVSGIELQPVKRLPFSKTVQLTGKVSLNQDHIAHIYPMVEGAVDEVTVSLGQSVKKDDLLVVIHSREIGEAKLLLYQARLQLEIAQVKDRLQTDITNNARELINELREQRPISEIESLFRNRAMGDYRERMLAAYSNYLKSQADVTRLETVADSGAISGKTLLSAEANRNADLATFQSRIEQIEYEMETAVLLSSQAVKEAETRVAVCATSLRILGCNDDDISDVNPSQQGESISHYPIRAPFDGTVLTKDVVLREQVRPDVLVLSIADLSTVWITTDIYEEHIPLLHDLENQSISIRNEIWPDRKFEGRVFYTGEVMDETTRTISMRAITDNSERLLKPGMFVTVELAGAPVMDAMQVPLSAIQEDQGEKFVFVHKSADKFERRNIDVGPANNTAAVIESGLNEGESVVTKGGFILKSRMLAELLGEE
jgi:cobalt-zinc-cadmium efflux system membrane fusion protein